MVTQDINDKIPTIYMEGKSLMVIYINNSHSHPPKNHSNGIYILLLFSSMYVNVFFFFFFFILKNILMFIFSGHGGFLIPLCTIFIKIIFFWTWIKVHDDGYLWIYFDVGSLGFDYSWSIWVLFRF
jgi:hypothetical protein